jgi:hypothetical protein
VVEQSERKKMTKEKEIIRKVKVIRADHVVDTYDDYYGRDVFCPVAGDWEEMTEQEIIELREALGYANRQTKDGYYFLVEYNDAMIEDIFKSAADFKEKMRKQQEREEKRKAEEKRKRDEKAQERKRKQLEKLKKELGEE